MNRNSKQWLQTLALALALTAAAAAGGAGMGMRPVESSWLDQAGYDEGTQTLTIRMKNSSDVYEFRGVPPGVYREFLEAESKGRYFATNIQGRYPTERR